MEIVEVLRDTVLEDRYFDMEALSLDAPPEETAARKAHRTSTPTTLSRRLMIRHRSAWNKSARKCGAW
jgi:hypothetical protein